jgi:carbamoyltransferase
VNILGINAFHADASACLLRDGQMVAAVAEERLNRRKHYAGFPALAIRKVLEIGGLGIRDVDSIAIGHDPSANLHAKLKHAALHPVESIGAARTAIRRQIRIRSMADVVSQECGFPSRECRFEVINVEHHLAHVSSSYYCSNFQEAAAFSFDASGDFASTLFGSCSEQNIECLKRIHLPHSLGYFYTALCQFIGFDRYGEEYKVMGLAAYGAPRYKGLLRKILAPERDGTFRLNPEYFSGLLTQSHLDLLDENDEIVVPPLYSEALVQALGSPRNRGAKITQRDRDIAASGQVYFEEITLHCLDWLHSQVPSNCLVMAGGCALNGVCNARILRDSRFDQTYIQCAAGDDGTALGAALWVWNSSKSSARSPAVSQAAWGPEYGDSEIEAALQEAGLLYQTLGQTETLEAVSTALADGLIVAWFQGRSEWGPRALGQRSILAHPGWPNMRDIINSRIKRREAFRPFAPSILADRVAEYFEEEIESPFMMHVVRIREDKRAELRAVTHKDNTGRLHTVSRLQNPMYYDLIERFAELTGTPVLLNTSFNENEPIVDTPAQAIDCFLRNDLDVLCMGERIVFKGGIELGGVHRAMYANARPT